VSRLGERSVVPFVFVLTALAASPSCGGSSTAGPGDAGGSNDAGASEGPILSHGACDLFAQDCPDGTRCDFFCDGASATIGCRAGATGAAAGQMCSNTNPCAKGTGCLANATTGTLCRPYCQSDADCAVGRCHIVSVAVGCAPGAMTTLMIRSCF
jgi:hypothetical protein